MNGRPRIYHETSKRCLHCDRDFDMITRGVAFPSQFAQIRYCSDECRIAGRRKWSSLGTILAAGQVNKATGCIEWQGRLCPKGYGKTTFDGRTARAHRVAYHLAHGALPDNLLILHNCDNRKCINPDHLRAGTAQDNSDDILRRGRLGKRSTGSPGMANNLPGQGPVSSVRRIGGK